MSDFDAWVSGLKLFTCLFGSKLYGTSTPTSDRDVKHLVLVPLDDLLLGKKLSNTVKKTNKKENTRNTVDDVDEEFVPLQIFARDFMMGQTYALEFAFAVEGDHAEQTFYRHDGTPYTVADVYEGNVKASQMTEIEAASYEELTSKERFYSNLFIRFVGELRHRFLTSNIKAMMGYVVNQASLYSFKGERLNASREFKELLEYAFSLPQTDAQNYTVGDMFLAAGEEDEDPYGLNARVEALEKKYPKYFKLTEYDIGGGRMKPCFTLLKKMFPFTNKLEHSLNVCDNLIKRYGARAEAASDTNVDWKATMHALRIVDEGLELLEHGVLEFPFKPEYVAKLLSIKRGEVPLADVTAELTEKLDRLKTLEQTTTLPAYSPEMQVEFDQWLAGWMRSFYEIRKIKEIKVDRAQ